MCAVKEYIKENGFTFKFIVSMLIITSIVLTAIMAIAFFIFNAEGASARSIENKKDIIVLKEDFREVKVKQETFTKTQDNMYVDLKDIQKDIKQLLRR